MLRSSTAFTGSLSKDLAVLNDSTRSVSSISGYKHRRTCSHLPQWPRRLQDRSDDRLFARLDIGSNEGVVWEDTGVRIEVWAIAPRASKRSLEKCGKEREQEASSTHRYLGS